MEACRLNSAICCERRARLWSLPLSAWLRIELRHHEDHQHEDDDHEQGRQHVDIAGPGFDLSGVGGGWRTPWRPRTRACARGPQPRRSCGSATLISERRSWTAMVRPCCRSSARRFSRPSMLRRWLRLLASRPKPPLDAASPRRCMNIAQLALGIREALHHLLLAAQLVVQTARSDPPAA